MYTTRQVMEKYGLSKNAVDNAIRRKKKNWGLVKAEDGLWLWPEESLKKFEEHLSRRRAVVAGVIDETPAGARQELVEAPAEKIGLILAKAIGEKMDSYKNEIVSLARKIENLEIDHRLQVEDLKMTLVRYQGTIEEKDKAIAALSGRVERRRTPATGAEWLWKKLVVEPFLWSERRKVRA